MSRWNRALVARQNRAAQRQQALAERLQAGEGLKRAAYAVGVSYRQARRYRAEAR